MDVEETKREGQTEVNARTVILQVEPNDREEEGIDLLNIAGHMKQKGRLFAYILVTAVCIGCGSTQPGTAGNIG